MTPSEFRGAADSLSYSLCHCHQVRGQRDLTKGELQGVDQESSPFIISRQTGLRIMPGIGQQIALVPV